MLGRLRRGAAVAGRGITTILALLFMIAIMLSFANAMSRYLWGFTFKGTEELQVFIMVAMAFIGAGVVAWRNDHLRLDLFRYALPLQWQKRLDLFERLVGIIIASYVVWIAWGYTARLLRLGMRSDTAGLPMWIPHATLVVGFGLVALSYVVLNISVRGARAADAEETAQSQ